MIKFLLIFVLFLSSCGYPDIDSIPDFKNADITIQESIELCKITNSDNNENSSCFAELNQITSRL